MYFFRSIKKSPSISVHSTYFIFCVIEILENKKYHIRPIANMLLFPLPSFLFSVCPSTFGYRKLSMSLQFVITYMNHIHKYTKKKSPTTVEKEKNIYTYMPSYIHTYTHTRNSQPEWPKRPQQPFNRRLFPLPFPHHSIRFDLSNFQLKALKI